MVLGLFRRKAPEPEPAAAPPAPAPKLPPPPRTDSSDDGTTELSVARRQGSQVNLNRLLGGAPHGLNAILKKSTMDADPYADYTPQPPPYHQQQQQQPQQRGDGDDAPAPRGTGRERRRSMTISEMVANMNNIHVGQAAMIMMPQRARQELGGGGDPGGQVAAPRARASSQPPEAGAALGSGVALAGMRGGLERQPSVIREAMKMQQSQSQPQSQQYQQQPAPPAQLSSPQVHSSGYSRSSVHHSHSHHHGHGHGEGLPAANLAQLAAALAGQGPAERAPAATRPGERRASMLLLQHSLGSVASGGGSNNSRSSATGGPGTGAQLGAGAAGAGGERGGQPGLAPQPPVAGGGSVRRSDPGEGFRMRALAPAQPNPMEVVINNVRGLNRSWNAGEEGGGGGGGGNSAGGGLGGISHSGSGAERQHQFGGGMPAAGVGGSASHGHGHGQGQSHSAKDMRSRAMRGSYSGSRGPGGGADTAGNNTEDGEARPPSVAAHVTAPGGSGAGGGGDLKLPSINGALPRARQFGDVSSDGRGALPGLPGGAGKGQLSQADVAAITEALAVQQNDAARIRAAALRKMDTRIKRTVMDRHMGPEDSGGGGDDGDSNSYSSSNARTPSKLSPQPNAQRSQLNRPVGVQPHMSAAESAVARAKARLLETEQETAEELNQLRKNSIIGPNGLLPNGKIPADLLADPMPPPRGRR